MRAQRAGEVGEHLAPSPDLLMPSTDPLTLPSPRGERVSASRRRHRTLFARLALAAAVACGIGLVASRAADEPPAARAEVGKPVQEAQALVRQKKYAEALERLKADLSRFYEVAATTK